MRGYLAAALIAVGLFAAPVMTQQPRAVPKEGAARIAKLIEALDADEFEERERATRELLALKGAAIEPLRKALAMRRSLELTRRAQRILDALAIHEPGGAVVNGLKVRLSADRTKVKAGEAVTLTTTLCNMTDTRLNVMVGHTTCGNYFECGLALRRAQPVPGKPAAEVEPKCRVGYCGTGAGPIYVTLPPKSVVRFHTPMTPAPQPNVYALGKLKHFTIEGTREAGALRMVLSNAPGQFPPPPNSKGAGVRPTDENAPFWSGTIRSNDVRLQFVP
jgi:hypothetical protein